MISKNVIIKDADFSGFKVLLNGTSVFQFPSVELAIQSAKNLDNEATSFMYIQKDGVEKELK